MKGARADQATETFVGAEALGLSEEELEGLGYDEEEVSAGHGLDDDDAESKAGDDADADDDNDAGDTPPEGDASGDDTDDDTDGEDDDAADTEGDDDDADGDEDDDAESDSDGPAPPPEPAEDPLKAIDDALKAARAERRDLSKKWSDGELGDSEFDSQRAELDEKIAELVGRRAYHQETRKDTESRRQQDFKSAVSSFFAKAPNKQFYADGSPEWYALDGMFQALQNDPAQQGKSYHDLLAEADRRIRKRFQADGAGERKKPKRTPKPPETPPSVADAPAAEGNDSEFHEFEELEDLLDTDIQAYEEALAKMPAEKRSAYDAWVERL